MPVLTPRFAVALCAAALTLAPLAAYAQDIEFYSGTNIVNSTYDSVNTYNAAITNFVTGADVTDARGFDTSTLNISGGSVVFASANATSTVNISGGSVTDASCFDTSTTNISGGSVTSANGNNTSTTNISGGSLTFVSSNNTGTVNISGGSVNRAYGFDTSTTNISGGTLTNGFLLFDTGATANFVGTGLSFAYQSYGNTTPYGTGIYADFFQISGTIGGAPKTVNLYIRNAAGAGGTPNSTARGFTFNGAAPVVVPEAGTLTLVLPAFALVGAVLTKRSFVTVRRRNVSPTA